MRRTAVGNQAGQRQQRQADFVPTTPQRIVSDEQMQYLEQVPKLQQQAAADPYLNGADALARLRGPHGG